jgi:hypothetical protein
MKSGAFKLPVFFCLMAAAAFGLQSLIDHGMRQVRVSDIGALNRVMSGKVNARIIINGSSRAMSHYDPDIIREATGETAFNLGRNGSQTDIQLAVLEAYLRHNAAPQIVIQNLDHFSFLTTTELYDPGRYIPYLNEPEIYQTLRQINPEVWRWKYLPLYGYAVEDMRMTWFLGFRQAIGLGPRPESNLLGFVPRDSSWTGEFSAFVAGHPDGVNVDIEPRAVADLEQMAVICRARNIQLILVYSPEYLPMQKLVNNRRQVFQKFDEIAKRAGVPLWDYSDSEICKNQELFSNSQHLNRQGAEAFSQDLAGRLADFLKSREALAARPGLSRQAMTESISNLEINQAR